MAKVNIALCFNRFVRFFLGFFSIFIVPNLNFSFRSQNVFAKPTKSGSRVVSLFPTVILNAGLEEMFSNLYGWQNSFFIFSLFVIFRVKPFSSMFFITQCVLIALYLVLFVFSLEFKI